MRVGKGTSRQGEQPWGETRWGRGEGEKEGMWEMTYSKSAKGKERSTCQS